MTDEIIREAARRIAEAQKQRDKARRELSRAKAIIRELTIVMTADIEAEEEVSVKVKAYLRGLRFIGKSK